MPLRDPRTPTRCAVLPLYAALIALGACNRAPAPVTTTGPIQTPMGPLHRVVVVSIDGLMPAAYIQPDRHGLRVPTLRMLRDGGAVSDGVTSVFPAVTFPAHTTIATGVLPATHGVVGNRPFDPLGDNQGGWFWYAEDIRAPTLWQLARADELLTALVGWPASVGAEVDALVPAYWRAGTADDLKLLKALSTPGLLAEVSDRFPGLWEDLSPPDPDDSARIDIAIHLLETADPALLMVRTLAVGKAQQRYGPWSEQAKSAIETADNQLARLLSACKRSGNWERTALVVMSAHGAVPGETRVRPGAWLRERELVELTPDGTPRTWHAAVSTNGGMAYVYVREPNNRAYVTATRKAIDDLAGRAPKVIQRVYSADEIRMRGGDPAALLAIEAAEGHVFAPGYDDPLVGSSSSAGHHGLAPDRLAMNASLIVYGPRITPGPIAGARLVDIAPTIAGWFGMSLTVDGEPLPIGVRTE